MIETLFARASSWARASLDLICRTSLRQHCGCQCVSVFANRYPIVGAGPGSQKLVLRATLRSHSSREARQLEDSVFPYFELPLAKRSGKTDAQEISASF